MTFVNRKAELNWLEEAYRSGRAGLLVLYGRRQVGKTELLRFFCREKRHVFFVPLWHPTGSSWPLFRSGCGSRPTDRQKRFFPFLPGEAAFRFMAGWPGRSGLLWC
ncbi:ATP-binding protein [Desulfofundulus thermocisternus]|uniref:ATP-binding protein n=1 Tax=Desulfofundulus thermocisternus TaxID=42471 RepID=UPI0004808CA5